MKFPVYKVNGACNALGENVSVRIVARNTKEASSIANSLGILVSSVELTEDDVLEQTNIDILLRFYNQSRDNTTSRRNLEWRTYYCIKGSTRHKQQVHVILPSENETDARSRVDKSLASIDLIKILPQPLPWELIHESAVVLRECREGKKIILDHWERKKNIKAEKAKNTAKQNELEQAKRRLQKEHKAFRKKLKLLLGVLVSKIDEVFSDLGVEAMNEKTYDSTTVIRTLISKGRYMLALSRIKASLQLTSTSYTQDSDTALHEVWIAVHQSSLVLSSIGRTDVAAQMFYAVGESFPDSIAKALNFDIKIEMLRLLRQGTHYEAISLLLKEILRQEPLHPDVLPTKSRLDYLRGSSSVPNLDVLTGHQFELVVAQSLREIGVSTSVTAGSGDYGADITFSLPDATVGVIQTKRYLGKVNLRAIQEIVAAKEHYGAAIAVVATTGVFMKSAVKLAKTNKVRLWPKEIITRLVIETQSNELTQDMRLEMLELLFYRETLS